MPLPEAFPLHQQCVCFAGLYSLRAVKLGQELAECLSSPLIAAAAPEVGSWPARCPLLLQNTSRW